jgi:NAD(P)-dependent dehydrogenase (short-subunit alcohol dehydrogenase family)
MIEVTIITNGQLVRPLRISSLGVVYLDSAAACPALHVEKNEYEAQMLAMTPLWHIGRPEDIAAAVAFPAFDDASWITGKSLLVSCGART